MTTRSDQATAEAPRALEFVCGLALVILGPAFVIFGIVSLGRVRVAPVPLGAVLICLAFIGAGVFCSGLAIRLLLRRPARSTTSLLSGGGWNVTGGAFVSIGVLLAIAAALHGAWGMALFGAVFCAVIARWCFRIAKQVGSVGSASASNNAPHADRL